MVMHMMGLRFGEAGGAFLPPCNCRRVLAKLQGDPGLQFSGDASRMGDSGVVEQGV